MKFEMYVIYNINTIHPYIIFECNIWLKWNFNFTVFKYSMFFDNFAVNRFTVCNIR